MTTKTPTVPPAVRALHLLERVAPSLAAEAAYSLWVRPGKRKPVHDTERPVMDHASRSTISVRGQRVAVYRWGTGPDAVLLVHGWQSRAAALAPLVRELRAAGRTIVAFDAPAHGESSGHQTNVRDYAAIIEELARQHDGFEAIVAHSFGTPGAALAIRNGVRVGRLVTVNGAADFEYLLAGFASKLGLRESTVDAVRRLTERRVFPGVADIWTSLSATAPLPAAVPWLVIHDDSDTMIGLDQAHALLDAHHASTILVVTHGLGHNRPLRDDSVLERISSFLSPAPQHQPQGEWQPAGERYSTQDKVPSSVLA
ncbi:alpha/beta hydrolase [Arthrobacter sp. CDRTa11]|uniref:alpha/beta fold hydrolase n=1 Tax=Arthrobacter sp. CDRTa11 TaxID=2651199 RepID=UPI0022659CEB|nr:alpha/beta hydrolase [Arthrobacter sp. CDRTa11]UZX02130.1 alpha/beta hydrolase [Arthrobacter sp. CDRTa11]